MKWIEKLLLQFYFKLSHLLNLATNSIIINNIGMFGSFPCGVSGLFFDMYLQAD